MMIKSRSPVPTILLDHHDNNLHNDAGTWLIAKLCKQLQNPAASIAKPTSCGQDQRQLVVYFRFEAVTL